MSLLVKCWEVISDILNASSSSEPSTQTLQSANANANANSSVGEDDDKKPDNVLLANAYECIGQAFPQRLPSATRLQVQQTATATESKDSALVRLHSPAPGWYLTQAKLLDPSVASLVAGLRAGLPWNVRVSILKALKR